MVDNSFDKLIEDHSKTLKKFEETLQARLIVLQVTGFREISPLAPSALSLVR